MHPLLKKILDPPLNGQQKPATCLATLLQNESNRYVARLTNHNKPDLQQIWLLTGLNKGCKTQQCCKTSFTFMLPDLPKLKTIISKSFVNVRLACRLFKFVFQNFPSSYHFC